MNKRTRDKSRLSGGLASSDRSAAVPYRKGGDVGNDGKQHQENQGGDVSPTHSEGIAVRPKQRVKKEKQSLSPRRVSIPAGLVVPEKVVVVLEQQQPKASRQSRNLLLSSSHYGGLASSDGSAATPYRKGGDERNKGKQQQDNKGGDTLPTHCKGIDVRLKQRPKKGKQWIPVGGVVREKLFEVREQQQQQQQHKAFSQSRNLSLSSSRSAVLKEVADTSADPPTIGKKNDKDVEYKTQPKKSSSSELTGRSSAKVGRLVQPKLRKNYRQSSDLPSNIHPRVASCAAPREKESIKHVAPFERDLLKKGSFDAKLLRDQSGPHDSCRVQSVEAQEAALSDEEETLTSIKLEMEQPEPSSGDRDLGKIAQDEVGYSGKKTSEDLSKIIALDEDEQHSIEIGAHAIQDRKQEQGGARRLTKFLLDMDDDAISKLISDCFDLLKFDPPDDHDNWLEHTPEQLTELYQRLAFYRISGYELTVDKQLPKLDNAYLEERLSPAFLLEQGYFKYYEEELDWYFDPELYWHACYDDYQRLVLCDFGEYRDWDRYHLIRNTYEQDLAYVQYCEAIATKTKWFEDYLVERPIQWKKIENVALLQALMVAAHVHNLPTSLLCSGLREHLWSIRFDHFNYKGMDGVYFEIWKRVSKKNMDFTNALSEIYRQNMFPSRNIYIEHELKNNLLRFSMKDNYDAHVSCIGETVSEDEALLLIKEAVTKMCPKSKTYVDYARKKLDIAKDIGLAPKGAILDVTPQCMGDDGETKLAMDN